MSRNLPEKIIVIGRSGQLASCLHDLVDDRKYQFLARPEFDVRSKVKTQAILNNAKVKLIINCSAYTNVDDAEFNEENAYDLNVKGTENLVILCMEHNIPLIHISTDYIFDGQKEEEYVETDEAAPLCVYGKTKLEAEQIIKKHLSKYVIIRTSWLFSAYGTNFVKSMILLARCKKEISVVNDQYGYPTSAHNLATAVIKIAEMIQQNDEFQYGLYHYTDDESMSWQEFASKIYEVLAREKNFPTPIVRGIPSSEYKTNTKRPRNSRLSTDKIRQLGVEPQNVEDSIVKCIQQFLISESEA